MPAGAATSNAEDPVVAALADQGIVDRLNAAARAFLGRRAYTLTATQRIAEAEEIVSIAQQRALERRDKFDPNGDVVKWLVGFVRTVGREKLGRANKNAMNLPNDAPRLEDLAVDLGLPVADALANRELADKLLSTLQPSDRELLRLKYELDLTFDEIATRLGSQKDAVRTQHYRLIVRLREQVGAREGGSHE
jgi:RNA polymerase sigma factor (sigma-70 family)